MQPLYGYDSEQNSYLVLDYPYGANRCQIRFWLERSPKKGFRFVSQTENPKTLRWNAPKKSTYYSLAGCMFLDEKGHCHWRGLSEYSRAEEALSFIKDFPQADLSCITSFAKMKVVYLQKYINGEAYITINGERQDLSPSEKDNSIQELKVWQECLTLLNKS